MTRLSLILYRFSLIIDPILCDSGSIPGDSGPILYDSGPILGDFGLIIDDSGLNQFLIDSDPDSR